MNVIYNQYIQYAPAPLVYIYGLAYIITFIYRSRSLFSPQSCFPSTEVCNSIYYCTILTNSSVTGHKAFQSEELVLLSQVTLPSEACDTIFLGLLEPKSFQNWQFRREFGLVTPPDGGEEMLISSWRSTGHKP